MWDWNRAYLVQTKTPDIAVFNVTIKDHDKILCVNIFYRFIVIVIFLLFFIDILFFVFIMFTSSRIILGTINKTRKITRIIPSPKGQGRMI